MKPTLSSLWNRRVKRRGFRLRSSSSSYASSRTRAVNASRVESGDQVTSAALSFRSVSLRASPPSGRDDVDLSRRLFVAAIGDEREPAAVRRPPGRSVALLAGREGARLVGAVERHDPDRAPVLARLAVGRRHHVRDAAPIGREPRRRRPPSARRHPRAASRPRGGTIGPTTQRTSIRRDARKRRPAPPSGCAMDAGYCRGSTQRGCLRQPGDLTTEAALLDIPRRATTAGAESPARVRRAAAKLSRHDADRRHLDGALDVPQQRPVQLSVDRVLTENLLARRSRDAQTRRRRLDRLLRQYAGAPH